ncbi:hypothetical protein DFA_03872 [Cavenderia fasciculata]|uniref:Leucine-rich repeat-containing protein n=1 Tax=Cavenderia fasciculata TaxID=261658 RepID=F4Q0M7_CACFS|nr:uncharacterized protein DFA_03872 [Cavenderia fasciculata]EGG18378.1 hypothetical protein DFA_03872 [Cavenderia fasciculata]|eukprot:XP_004366282.1 hypothetical protein DFA_03872 [Cavenderia fasciculata]
MIFNNLIYREILNHLLLSFQSPITLKVLNFNFLSTFKLISKDWNEKILPFLRPISITLIDFNHHQCFSFLSDLNLNRIDLFCFKKIKKDQQPFNINNEMIEFKHLKRLFLDLNCFTLSNHSIICNLEELKLKFKPLSNWNHPIDDRLFHSIFDYFGQLVSLDLSDNRLGPELLQDKLMIVFGSNVEHLNLAGNSLGGELIEKIGLILSTNCTCKWINLSRNEIQLKIGPFLKHLEKNNTLEYLDIGENFIHHHGYFISYYLYFKSQQRQTCSLKTLIAGSNNIPPDQIIPIIVASAQCKLSHLSLIETMSIDSSLLPSLVYGKGCFEGLESLELSMCTSGIDAMDELMINHLVSNLTFKSLDISFSQLEPNLQPKMAKILSLNKSINHLNLGYSFSKDSNNSFGCIEFTKELIFNHSLVSLDLSGNGLEPEDGAMIGVWLDNNKSLIELKLQGNNLGGGNGGKGIGRIFQSLILNNSTLKSLDLKSNNISKLDSNLIYDLLTLNTSLLWLSMKSNDLGFDEKQSIEWINGISKNRSLTYLDLSINNFDHFFQLLLMQSIKDNNNNNNNILSSLYLNNNINLINQFNNIKPSTNQKKQSSSSSSSSSSLSKVSFIHKFIKLIK